MTARRIKRFIFVIFGLLVVLIGVSLFSAISNTPKIENQDNIKNSDVILFERFLQDKGYFTGLGDPRNLFKFKYLDKIIYTESIVDIDDTSKIISSARFWVKEHNDPIRLLLIDGKVVVVTRKESLLGAVPAN